MDKYTKEAAEQIPVGFYRVIGQVKPTDLAWSWTSKEWIRVDSPDWLHKPGPYASMSVCVIRDKYAEPEPIRVVHRVHAEAYDKLGFSQPELFTT